MWQICARGDDMLWTAEKLGVERKPLVLAGCQCTRLVLHLAKAPMTAACIATVERWCWGKASIEEIRKAVKETGIQENHVADAKSHAEAAIYRIASSATDGDYRATHAAFSVAETAFWDNFHAPHPYADYARDAMHWKCADIVRKEISWSTIKELIDNNQNGKLL
jgi:hypothetical protein